MKIRSILACYATCGMIASAFGSPSVSDGVMTIKLTADTAMSTLTAEKALLDATPCTITNVVLLGGKTLTLDASLNTYAGGWEILDGVAKPTVTNAFGIYSETGEVRIGSKTGKYPQLYLNGNVEIDKVVRFTESRAKDNYNDALLATYNTSNVFKRKVYAAGDWWFFGAGTHTTEAGFEQPETGTIKNQGNGTTAWTVKNVPVTIGDYRLNICKLYLCVASNTIHKLTAYGMGSSTVGFNATNAIAGYPTKIICNESGKTGKPLWFNLMGIDTTWGTPTMNYGKINAGSGTPTLTLNCTEAGTFRPVEIKNPLKIAKTGSEKLTIGKDIAVSENGGIHALTIREGSVGFETGMNMFACKEITLDGGKIDVTEATTLPTLSWTVTSASAAGAIRIANGLQIKADSLTVNGKSLPSGIYGGANASVPDANKLACFDETMTGTLCVGNYYTITLPGGNASFTNLVNETTRTKLTNNEYTWIIVKGSGTLVLDGDLTGYTGGWDIWQSTLKVTNPKGLGTYENDANEVRFMTTSARIYLCGGEIDKPLHYMVSNKETNAGKAPLDMDSCTTYLKRKVTMEGDLGGFFRGAGTVYFDGGVEQKSGSTYDQAASGKCYIRYKPAKFNMMTLNNQPVVFQVASNDVGRITFIGSGKVIISCNDALSGGAGKTIIDNSKARYIGLENGCSRLEVGALNLSANCWMEKSGGTADLILTGDTDSQLKLSLPDTINLIQAGAGKLTLARSRTSSTNTLTVKNGSFAFAEGVTWPKCSSVTLEGGTLELNEAGIFTIFPAILNLYVPDTSKTGLLKIADGLKIPVNMLYENGTAVSTAGYYGGANSAATTKRDWFDATATGLLQVSSPYTVEIPSGTTRTLTEEELTYIRAGKTYSIRKQGTGTLKLDTPLTGYRGEWDIRYGTVLVTTHDRAFGEDNDNVIHIYNGNNASFYLKEGTINRPVESLGVNTGGYANYLLQLNANTSNVCARTVTGDSGINIVLYASSNVKLVTKEAFDAGGTINAAAGGGKWIASGPIAATSLVPNWFEIALNAPSNRIGTLNINSGATITIGSDDCFAEKPTLLTSAYIDNGVVKSQQYLNLNGHDISVGNFSFSANSHIYTSNNKRAVTFGFNAATNTVLSLPHANLDLTGPISFVKGGAGTLAITNTLPGTGGFIQATAGTLVLEKDATLPHVTNFVLSGNVQCEIADNKVLRFDNFTWNGIAQKCGTYGGTASNAKNKWEVPFGSVKTGRIYARAEGTGSVLIIR